MLPLVAQDFHSAVEGALSDEDYVAELYEAMLEEGREALERGMELAAQRAVRKAEVKVHTDTALAKQLLLPVTRAVHLCWAGCLRY